MHHTCDQKFDLTENLKNFCELNKALLIFTNKEQRNCNLPDFQVLSVVVVYVCVVGASVA